VALACERIDRLAKLDGKPKAANEKPARADAIVDETIPF
jgi:hypothetical protein